MRTVQSLGAHELLNSIWGEMGRHRKPKLSAEHAGPIALYLVDHRGCTLGEMVGFIDRSFDIKVDPLTLRRFFKTYGLGVLRGDREQEGEQRHAPPRDEGLGDRCDRDRTRRPNAPCRTARSDAAVGIAAGQDRERAALRGKHPQPPVLLGEQPAHRFGRRIVGHQPRHLRRAMRHPIDGESAELLFDRAPFDVAPHLGRSLAQIARPLLVQAVAFFGVRHLRSHARTELALPLVQRSRRRREDRRLALARSQSDGDVEVRGLAPARLDFDGDLLRRRKRKNREALPFRQA
jgi:hypothetical protein